MQARLQAVTRVACTHLQGRRPALVGHRLLPGLLVQIESALQLLSQSVQPCLGRLHAPHRLGPPQRDGGRLRHRLHRQLHRRLRHGYGVVGFVRACRAGGWQGGSLVGGSMWRRQRGGAGRQRE